MHTEKVTCDGCGADLTTTSNSVDYRLVLGSEMKPHDGTGFYAEMEIWPAIKRDHHFCGLLCLDRWRGREKHVADAMMAWNDAWIAQHRTRSGSSIVWVPASAEAVKDQLASARAAALEAFPMRFGPGEG